MGEGRVGSRKAFEWRLTTQSRIHTSIMSFHTTSSTATASPPPINLCPPTISLSCVPETEETHIAQNSDGRSQEFLAWNHPNRWASVWRLAQPSRWRVSLSHIISIPETQIHHQSVFPTYGSFIPFIFDIASAPRCTCFIAVLNLQSLGRVRSTFKSPCDAIAIFVHACILSVGLRLVGLTEDDRVGIPPRTYM